MLSSAASCRWSVAGEGTGGGKIRQVEPWFRLSLHAAFRTLRSRGERHGRHSAHSSRAQSHCCEHVSGLTRMSFSRTASTFPC